MKNTTPKPLNQRIKAYVLANIVEDILNASEADDPFNPVLTSWAHKIENSTFGEILWDYPEQTVSITWPCIPLGRDNSRIRHSFEDAKRRYREIFEEPHEPAPTPSTRATAFDYLKERIKEEAQRKWGWIEKNKRPCY